MSGQPREQIVRYERAASGELVHVDCKKLGRILRPGHRVTGDRRGQAKGKAGWQYLFVAIDDHSRLGLALVYGDETAASSTAFLAELVRSTKRTGSRWNPCSPTDESQVAAGALLCDRWCGCG
jgi:hypothetical protein